MAKKIASLLSRMTLEEKTSLQAGVITQPRQREG
jgi:hypothetical protein